MADGDSAKSAADFDFTAMAPEDAVEYFERKGFDVGFAWQDVWQAEHARAFTVAKAMTVDLLQDIRTMVDKAIEDGIAFEDFKKNLTPILRARGWWGRQMMVDPLTGEKRNVQLGSVRHACRRSTTRTCGCLTARPVQLGAGAAGWKVYCRICATSTRMRARARSIWIGRARSCRRAIPWWFHALRAERMELRMPASIR